MCRRQEHCVTTGDISFLRFLREEVELRRFEETFRFFSPEYSGNWFLRNLKVSTKLRVSHPTDIIPHASNRHKLLFNKPRVFKDTVLRKLFGL
jgi:hypothetical protein